MRSQYTLAAFVSLALFANCVDSRRDSGVYWRQGDHVPQVKPQPAHVHKMTSVSNGKSDCDGSTETSSANNKMPFANDFEPRPSATAYVNNEFEPRPSVTAYVDNLKPNDKGSFVKDFEPRPSATAYVNSEFEPRPSITAYVDNLKPNDKGSFVKDFEPRPSATAYVNSEFEPRPSITAYVDNLKPNDKSSFVKEFEPRPNISAYDDDAIGEKVVKASEEGVKGQENGSVKKE